MSPEEYYPPGKTTIAPEVLTTIARLTTMSVPGVSQMAPVPGEVNRLFNRNANDGVKITVERDTVYADLYVILCRDTNVREIGRAIQSRVSRAISEMVGMDVGKVNVHVEDIDYSVPEPRPL
ncbi:MAG TPA: Asp23/Gls24 family envelope stress response protein [Anaerolineaceae bacterium]|nr:Asp23/Gls24 family envelope stress response protein [Anaerolineaceae bacterium]